MNSETNNNNSVPANKRIILYDGVCNFCNAVVNFVAEKDRKNNFRFAPLQSREARAILRSKDEAFVNLKTVYLVDEKGVFKRSQAIFNVFKKLPYPWKLLSAFSVLPASLTDFFYKIIAKNRYKWFGKSDTVIEPKSLVKERSLS